MYRVFQSIKEAYNELKRELRTSGKIVYNERTKKITREIVGVLCRIPIDYFMNYYVDRPENEELETAFEQAMEYLYNDSTARYAVGIPQVNYNEDRLPCPVAIQILIREIPLVIVYMRSQNIEQLSNDFAVVARKTFIAFGYGEILWFIGSLHEEVDENISG